MIITLKEAFEDLYNRIQKQLAETLWTIKRVKPMSSEEVEEFQGSGVKKKLLLKNLQKEKTEREKNLEVVKEIIENYGQK